MEQGSSTVDGGADRPVNSQARGVRISVLTATRNCAATLDALYQSLARQTYREFEWVVMDGLSEDGTLEQLRAYALESPWVKVTSEHDFGLYDALNKAILTAAGEYYVVAGADDVFEPDALEQFAKVAARDRVDVVLAHVMRNGREIGGFNPKKAWLGHAQAFRGSHSIGMLIRKDLHNRFALYSRRFPLLADGYFLKLLLRAGSVRFADATFIAGAFAEGGMSSVNKLQVLTETWQIQMRTERFPLLQTLIFLGKLVIRYPAVRRELQADRECNLRR